MVQRKVHSLQKVYEAFHRTIPGFMKTDLNEIIRHLQRWVDKNKLDYEDIWDILVITPIGTLFKPFTKVTEKSRKLIGEGLLISTSNEVTKADFSLGVVKWGIMQKLYKNGEFFSGNCLEKGIKQGPAKVKYPNGNLYEGEFTKGRKTGIARITFSDGSEYFGEFTDDEISGHGTYVDSKGNEFTSKVSFTLISVIWRWR